jgi:hypothetical protein
MGHAFLFLAVGVPILVLDAFVDIFWFLCHLYKMDLERAAKIKSQMDAKELQITQTIGKGGKVKGTMVGGSSIEDVEINRRTYKKMLNYFE